VTPEEIAEMSEDCQCSCKELDQYKAWWERDSIALGNALNEVNLLRACNEDFRAQIKQLNEKCAETQAELDHTVASHARRQHEPSVTRLPVPGTKLARLSDIADDLVKEMRRQGMETLQSVFDGVKVRVEPWREPQPWGTKREICTAEQGHSYSQYTEGRRCIFCGSPGTEVKSGGSREG